jgi:hypothetical protein
MSRDIGRRDAGRLPAALEQEIEELGRFRIRPTKVADRVILTTEVRGVPVVITLDIDDYPARPPHLEIAREWTGGRRGRPIDGLESQSHWNRTLGIGALLRELEQRFVDDPPRRPSRGGLLQLLRTAFYWLENLLRRLFRRRGAASSEIAMPDAIRARYREIIDEKSRRVERYQQAVAQLMMQWQRKSASLERLGQEIQRQERAEADKLAEAERLVDELKAGDLALEQIRADARYQRCLGAYEQIAADLGDQRRRFTELETDAEEHLAKLQEHRARLEALAHELEELEDESADVAADLTTVQLEQEIADLRAGITSEGSERELRQLLRQFRKAKAAVRITREAADLEDAAQDAEYLEVARKVEAAKRFEESVGLEPTRAEERARE